MDINPDINHQKHTIDLSQFNLPKHPQENKTAVPRGAENENPTDTTPDASTVNLSDKGRAASFTFDFNATADNLSKLNTLRNSKSFARAHASISYENVKNLLE